MKLNRFFHSRSDQRSIRAKRSLTRSVIASLPTLEKLENRQLMSITLDVRTASGGKTATVTSVGEVVNMNLYAVISGSTAGSNDAMVSATGSLIGTPTSVSNSVIGNILGSVSTSNDAFYGASGASNGTQQDLNGDGGKDVGSNNNSDAAGFFSMRAGGANYNGVVSGNTSTFFLATLTYTVTDLNFGAATKINFKYRNGVPSGAFDAVWVEDQNGQNDQIGTVLIGTPVTITDPNLTAPTTGSIAGTISKVVSGATSAFSGVAVSLLSGSSTVATTTTNSTGAYSFSGVTAGTYTVHETVPSGYSETSPAGDISVTLAAGQDVTGKNFTDTAVSAATGSISGAVSGASGVTVYLDANNNSSLDNGELSTTANGSYSFSGVPAGNYVIRQVVPSGYTQTSPASNAGISVTVASGSNFTNENFTDTANSTGSSKLNGTGIGTAGSYQNNGLTLAKALDGNLTTYFDGPTANGVWVGLDLGSTYVVTSVAYSSRSGLGSRMNGGIFQGSNSPSFASGVVNLFTIPANANPSATALTTQTVSNTTAFRYVRYLSPNGGYGNIGEAQFFGKPSGTTATGGSVSGSVSGVPSTTIYLDANNNGVLDSGELSTSTSGSYSFSGVPAGSYVIRQVVPSGYTQTTPASGYAITVSNGSSVTGENFVDTANSTNPTGTKLSGTAIGTSGSYQNAGNTIAKALDGNLTTFFDGPTANGNWVGLDLGTATVITSVSYASRSGQAARMNGGIFQGSNSATFASGVVNLYTIASNANPSSTSLTTQTISNSTAFRYVRYLSPNGSYGDVAEVQFYGNGSGTVTPPPTFSQFTGTTIGTAGSYQNGGTTIAKATDGSLTTFYDGASANGNWVGLDLGSGKVVQQISFAPRSSPNLASRMVGGIFQASNTADFSSGAVNIYTVSSAPAINTLTTVSVSVSSAFRYYRYLSPNGSYGDVAEVQFFG